MATQKSSPARKGGGAARRVEKERRQFRTLLAINPNYFGNLPDSAFELVKKIVGNTRYEELTCVGYNPHRVTLEATVEVKRPVGYGGGLCTDGSEEYVRFYVDFGSGWNDVGLVATKVHDLPTGEDCAGANIHPLTYVVSLPFDPKKLFCWRPQLPRVRAILSWEVEPPPDQPDWSPIWGNVRECHVQIDKSKLLIAVVEAMAMATDTAIPPDLLEQLEEIKDLPLPLPDPPPLEIAPLADLYKKPAKAKTKKTAFSVEPHRFGFAKLNTFVASPTLGETEYEIAAQPWKDLGLELGDLVVQLDKTKGNVAYEELECLGLDNNRDQLAATYRVKKRTGYSGGLCSAGSNEYVAFWADWQNKCKWTYLGTVRVKAYDFDELPEGGLCYTAILPVDLSKVQRPCRRRVIGRVRAVLSWNSPPSTVDPNAVPHWGNRIDTHVQVRPGRRVTKVFPNMTVVGGIAVEDIHDVTGLTKPGARFVDTGLKADYLDRTCPFGRRVVIRGLQFPGHRYRVQVREVGDVAWTTLTRKIWVTPVFGAGSFHYAHSDGYFKYLSHWQNFAGILAYFDTSGDAMWDIRLQIEGLAGQVDQRVQLDNTRPDASIEITSGPGSCGMFTPGTTIMGKFVARDLYFRNYGLTVKGHPSANTPSPGSGSVQTSPAGDVWKLNTTGMAECGYVIEVVAHDRSILNSIASHHRTSASVGFCITK